MPHVFLPPFFLVIKSKLRGVLQDAVSSLPVLLLFISAGAFAADVASVSRLAFGPDDVLFVADWKQSKIHAVKLPPAEKSASSTFNLENLDAVLAKALGTKGFTVEHMAVRPGTGNVYLALRHANSVSPLLVSITGDGRVRKFDFKNLRGTSLALKDAVKSDRVFYRATAQKTLTVTDMKWFQGELFVAGLSNQDFSSTLRRVRYPFAGDVSVTSIEMFHTLHNQIETRAPIRSMAFMNLGGKPYMAAAFTCTPLVILPVEDLKDGEHVKAKTVAELGLGNTPTNMLSFSRKGWDGKSSDFLMVTLNEMGANVIPIAQLEKAAQGPGLTQQVEAGKTEGVTGTPYPYGGVFHVDDLNPDYFLVLRRHLREGHMQLLTVNKKLNFRISDFIGEYSMPGYKYPAGFQAEVFRPVQNMMKMEEGYPEEVIN